jgi:hypothetical protein
MAAETVATVGLTTKHEDPKIWGETYGFWCQTSVLLGAAIFAYVAIISAKRTERRKAAIEEISSGKKDEELTKAIRLIAKLHAEE